MRILIAEDDSRLLTQLDTLLQQNGYSVDLADNGEHALYQLNEFPYDLAIIDIGLPKLDGFDVIRKARQADVSCPVLILTARDRWQEKVEGLDAGADDFLDEVESWEIVTDPEAYEAVSVAVRALGVEPVSAQLAMLPQNYLKLEGSAARQILKLMEILEDHDDVQRVWSNFDIEAEEIEASLA